MTSTPTPTHCAMPHPGASVHARAAQGSATTARTRRMVDAPVRMFHALFALCFVGAYLSAESEALRLLHVTLGYSMAGLLGFRLVYGLWGPRHARLALLGRKLAAGRSWLSALRGALRDAVTAPEHGTAVRPPVQAVQRLALVSWRQGHSLLLAASIAGVLMLVLPLAVSGYATYNEWGDWLSDVHELLGNSVLALVLLHIGLVLLGAAWGRQPGAIAMVHGRVAGPGPDLAPRNRAWLAVLLLVAVLGYWRWEAHQSPHGLVSAQAVQDLLSGAGDDD